MDPYSGDIYNAIGNNTTRGIPAYVVDGIKLPITSYTEENVKDAIVDAVDSSQVKRVIANVVFSSEIKNDSLLINCSSKLFRSIKTGAVYIGAFVVEHNVEHVTSGVLINDHSVLRTVAGSKTRVLNGYLWIDKLFNSFDKAETIKDVNFKVSLNSKWKKDDLETVVVLWHIDSSKVEALNCANKPISKVAVYPHKKGCVGSMKDFEFENSNGKYKLAFRENSLYKKYVRVFNVSGEVVYSVSFDEADNVGVLPLEQLSDGVYLISCSLGSDVVTKRVIVSK